MRIPHNSQLMQQSVEFSQTVCAFREGFKKKSVKEPFPYHIISRWQWWWDLGGRWQFLIVWSGGWLPSRLPAPDPNAGITACGGLAHCDPCTLLPCPPAIMQAVLYQHQNSMKLCHSHTLFSLGLSSHVDRPPHIIGKCGKKICGEMPGGQRGIGQPVDISLVCR